MESKSINPEIIKQLKKRYEEAIKNNEEQFIFDNQIVLTAYAKYLIEFLGSHVKIK